MTTGKTIALTRQTFVCKVMSLLLNMLSRFVTAFLPRSKLLLISWLKPPCPVILEPKKIKFVNHLKKIIDYEKNSFHFKMPDHNRWFRENSILFNDVTQICLLINSVSKGEFFFLANFIPPLISSFDFDGVKNKSFSTKKTWESDYSFLLNWMATNFYFHPA